MSFIWPYGREDTFSDGAGGVLASATGCPCIAAAADFAGRGSRAAFHMF